MWFSFRRLRYFRFDVCLKLTNKKHGGHQNMLNTTFSTMTRNCPIFRKSKMRDFNQKKINHMGPSSRKNQTNWLADSLKQQLKGFCGSVRFAIHIKYGLHAHRLSLEYLVSATDLTWIKRKWIECPQVPMSAGWMFPSFLILSCSKVSKPSLISPNIVGDHCSIPLFHRSSPKRNPSWFMGDLFF